MKLQPIYDLLARAELFVWLAALGAALTARLARTFPALVWLLGVRATAAAIFDALSYAYPAGSAGYYHAYTLYFHLYWALYFLATLATFFCIEQLLRDAFFPLPGLSRLAVFVFRFTGGLCLFIALTAHLPVIGKVPALLWFQALSISFDLCMCVFEVALVSVLFINARRLGLSLRTRVLGFSLGFLLFGTADIPMLVSDIAGGAHPLLALASQLALYAAIVLWSAYLLAPEGKRGPLALKPNSTLMRWNEIVNQLGGGAAVAAPATSFMSEVEVLVERIMMRNSDHRL